MQRLLSTVVVLAWGLWTGAIMMVFVTVTSLFATFDRPTAGLAAAGVFRRFEVLELGVAAAGLLGAAGWRLTARSRARTAVLLLLTLATLGACVSRFAVTPRIDQLRLAGAAGSSEFKKLHGVSSSIYLAQAIILVTAGVLLPAALSKRPDAANV